MQNPFAAILACSDSHAAPELFFEQGLGDIFTITNAGGAVAASVLGTLEYAVLHLEVPLIVVYGHSKCGAVTAACSNEDQPKYIQTL